MRLRPARTQALDSVKILSDFDSMVTEEVGFKFMGKIHILKPVSVENFMRITIAYRKLIDMLQKRSQGEALTDKEVFQRYYDLIHPIVPTIQIDQIESMTLVMLNNLVNLVLRQISGDPTLYDSDQKKNPLIP